MSLIDAPKTEHSATQTASRGRGVLASTTQPQMFKVDSPAGEADKCFASSDTSSFVELIYLRTTFVTVAPF